MPRNEDVAGRVRGDHGDVVSICKMRGVAVENKRKAGRREEAVGGYDGGFDQ